MVSAMSDLISLPVYLSVCLSVFLSLYLSVSLFQSVFLSVCVSICASVSLSRSHYTMDPHPQRFLRIDGIFQQTEIPLHPTQKKEVEKLADNDKDNDNDIDNENDIDNDKDARPDMKSARHTMIVSI